MPFLTFRRVFAALMTIIFVMGSVQQPYAQTAVSLPEPGQMMSLSAPTAPAMLRGFTIDPQDPFSFEFLMDRGQALLADDAKKAEYAKQIKYFLASLAIPEKDLWVNLSPYENDRIIADNFGLTAMGRDLLAQDYILKQITSSLIHPDSELGRAFWDKVYKAAAEQYGTTNIPVDTFNKVWIMPDQAEVYANGLSVILVKSHLKVMLDADRTAARHNMGDPSPSAQDDVSKDVMREVVLPILEKEVNEGANFAAVRQITSALILATWYKKQWQERLLNTVYTDRSKVKGVDQDPANNTEIYQKYVEAFKQGVFNFIKEEVDAYSQEPVPRKYFSGGYTTKDDAQKPLSERIARLPALPSGVDFSQSDSVHSHFNFFHPFGENKDAAKDMGGEFNKKYASLISQDASNRRPAGGPQGEAQDLVKVAPIFTDYFKKHLGAAVLKWDYPVLAELLKDRRLDGEDVFDVMALALREKFAPWYKALDHGRVLTDNEESDLEMLSFQAVRLIQNVLIDAGPFNPAASSIADILEGRGWNSSSLSMATVILADFMGIRGVSMVEIDMDQEDVKYPWYSIYHFANLLRVGSLLFVLDQGRQSLPDLVMVVDPQNNTSMPSSLAVLDPRPELFGLDAQRLVQHVEAVRNLNALKEKVNRELTEDLFRSYPERYAAINSYLHKEFDVVMKKYPAIRWLESVYDMSADLLYVQLAPERWNKMPTVESVQKERKEFIRDLNELLERAGDGQEEGYFRQDPLILRRVAYLYRLAVEAAFDSMENWKSMAGSRGFLQDGANYAYWEDELDALESIIKNAKGRANVLDFNAAMYAAKREIEHELNRFDKIKAGDPKGALAVLQDLDQRVDLFIAFFGGIHTRVGSDSVTPLDHILAPFYQVKQVIAQDQEKMWDILLDNYNTLKAGGNVDKGQAQDVVGGIDLDPSKFDIKARGAADVLFAQVPAADAVQIEGLEPQILSITPGEGFLKRFDIK